MRQAEDSMRVIFFALTILLSLALTPSVYAKPTAPANGGLSGTYTIADMRHAGNNVIIDFTSSYVLTGTLSGSCAGVERDVIHSNENRTFFGTCTFKGTVEGRSGTALLRYQGIGSLVTFKGTTTVKNGTDGLTGLILEASFTAQATGPLSATGTYSGHFHL